MKSLKVLACAACLLGTVSSVGFAKDVQTIAGSMVVPNNVNVVSASKTNTRDFVEKQMKQNSSKNMDQNILVLVELISYSRMIGILKEQWKICVNI